MVGWVHALVLGSQCMFEHLPMLDQDRSLSGLSGRVIKSVEDAFLSLVGLKVHNLTNDLGVIRLILKQKIKRGRLISKLGLVVFGEGQQIFTMTTNSDLSPWVAFKHHLLPLEVDANAQSFNDGSAHQHRSLTFDDKSLGKSKRVVDEDWDPCDPMAGS